MNTYAAILGVLFFLVFSNNLYAKGFSVPCPEVNVEIRLKDGTETVVELMLINKSEKEIQVSKPTLGIDEVEGGIIKDVFWIKDLKGKRVEYYGQKTKANSSGLIARSVSLQKHKPMRFEADLFNVYIRRPGKFQLVYKNEMYYTEDKEGLGSMCKIHFKSNSIILNNTKSGDPIGVDGKVISE